MVLSNLLKASFKGAEFFLTSSRVSFGQKTVVHEFPNSNSTQVEFLGLKGDEFNIQAIITGQGNDYFIKRDSFVNALKSSGAGVLVHPFDGRLRVSVINADRTEEDTNVGICKFSITFKLTGESIYPEISTNNKSKISYFKDAVFEATLADIADFWGIDADPYNFEIAQEKLNQVSDNFTTNVTSVNTDSDFISDMMESIDNFTKNINTNINNASNLATAFNDLFENLNFLGADATSQFTLLKKFFDFGENDPIYYKVDSFASEQSATNTNLINNGVLYNSLALAYVNATQYVFTNTEEIDNISNSLEDQFDTIVSNDISDNLRFQMSNLRNEARKYFDIQRGQVADIATTEIKSYQGITPITYRYYGNTDLSQNLLELNNIGDANFVKGELRVLTSE